MTKYCSFIKNDSYEDLMCQALSADMSDQHLEEFRKLFDTLDQDVLFKRAFKDEVASHIAFKMKKCNIPLNEKWEKEYIAVEKRIDNLMTELEYVASNLAKHKIKIIALKNAGITKGLFKNLACSPMGDIDLLVNSTDFRKAHEIILKQLGYTFKFRSELEEEDLEEAFKGGGTEYYKDIGEYRVWLELQWRPVAGRWIQPHNEPNGDELVENSVSIDGSDVFMLNPVDNLLQVALHTAKHSFCRAPGFRLHSDVDRIVRFSEIDWNAFLNKVKNMHLKTAVYFSLALSKELVNTPVPQNVLKELEPSTMNGKSIAYFLKKADIFDQHKKKFSKIGYILFNLSLYDSKAEIIKAILPPPHAMKEKYGIESNLSLPFFYIKRLTDLVFKRAKL